MMRALEIRSHAKHESIRIFSAYDDLTDKKYHSGIGFKGFRQNKLSFTIYSLITGIKADKVLIAHVNLALIGFLLKWLKPSIHLMTVTHGIEVWGKLSWVQKRMLLKSDEILAVSHYTQSILIEKHHIPAEKIKIFRNTLDPYFNSHTESSHLPEIKAALNIPENSKVLLTIARLNSFEKSKGYDKVVQLMPTLLKKNPDIHYIIAGKYSQAEFDRILQLSASLGIEDRIHLPGFILDKELPNYYAIADVFVMPSTKEGFGIVFIEAMACGTPAIAGNIDGSKDTVLNKELGSLIDPNNLRQIEDAIQYWLDTGKSSVQQASHLVWETFGFNAFTQNVKNL